MTSLTIHVPFTICFCIQDDKVLMIYRNKIPNKHLWNGIGGKIEPDEKPFDAVKREIREEAGIIVDDKQIQYGGVVSWTAVHDTSNHNKGMYTFIIKLPPQTISWEEKEINEGKLAWLPLAEVCAVDNKQVVSNIPRFLPHMMNEKKPQYYYFRYVDGLIEEITIEPLLKKYQLIK